VRNWYDEMRMDYKPISLMDVGALGRIYRKALLEQEGMTILISKVEKTR